jgi:hypothetical protein
MLIFQTIFFHKIGGNNMRNSYSDPTGNAAIGATEREFKKLLETALTLRALKRVGGITPEREREVRRQFTGLYGVLLEDDFLDKIEEERNRRAKK